nr:immunoglobulin light chain junction region [Macaca mulatta]
DYYCATWHSSAHAFF